tara:strand:- start:704 stop:916 length:213 start_codon:yes stop_codon:yes gene_type:complete
MKVLFENYPTSETKSTLSVEQFTKEEVTISIDYTKLFDEEYHKHLGILLNKKQLSDFIGALLHIQAKMRK